MNWRSLCFLGGRIKTQRRIYKQEKSEEKIKMRNRADELERKGLESFSDEQKNNILKSAKDAANIYQRSIVPSK